MVTLFVQNNIQKTRTQNTQWKQRYRWKRYRSMTWRNGRHFPPASVRMTPINTCLWRYIALPIEDCERNLTKSILARVCTLNVFCYSKLLRSVQWKVHKNTLLKQDILLLWGGVGLNFDPIEFRPVGSWFNGLCSGFNGFFMLNCDPRDRGSLNYDPSDG